MSATRPPLPDWTHFGIQLVAPLPVFCGLVRDRILVRRGHPEPVNLHRTLPPDYATIITALERRACLPLNPLQPVDDLIGALEELLEQGAGLEQQRSVKPRAEMPGLRLLK